MKRFSAIMLGILMLLSLTACMDTDIDIKDPSNVTGGANVADVTVEEAVLLDESGVKITAKSFDANGFMGPELKILIENNSGKNLTVQCRESSVNGYMVETMISADVADGKKANDTIVFMGSDLELCDISTIADMEFSFHIFETDSWNDYLDSDLISVKTSAANDYTYSYDDSGELAYDQGGIKITIKGLAEDTSVFGPSVVVYIANTTNESITVQTRDTSINGFMIDGMFSCEVGAGKYAVDSITFFDSDLEDNGITAIESIETSFHIFETNSWNNIADTNPITIGFN